MKRENYEGIINFYGALFGIDGKEFANNNKDVAYDNVKKYFELMETMMPEKELFIIKKYYGIGFEAKSIEEIAKELNDSKEKVIELKEVALRMLKHPSRSRIGYPILTKVDFK